MAQYPKPLIYDHAGQRIHGIDFHNPDTVVNLPELYCKKFRLIESLESLRRDYVPPVNMLDEKRARPKPQRNLIKWDIILEDAKWAAIDMMENRKAKLAVSSFISKKAKKIQKEMETHQEEIKLYHRLIASEMATMVTKAFDLAKKKNIEDLAINVKEEDQQDELIKVEEEKKEMSDEDTKNNEDLLDIDKIKEEQEEKEKQKRSENPIDAEIYKLFKAGKAKNNDKSVMRYLQNFAYYEKTELVVKEEPKEIIDESEEKKEVPQEPPAKDAKKIDKQHYLKELQKCFGKWSKNKYAPDLYDALFRLLKDHSDLDKGFKATKGEGGAHGGGNKEEKSKKKRQAQQATGKNPPTGEHGTRKEVANSASNSLHPVPTMSQQHSHTSQYSGVTMGGAPVVPPQVVKRMENTESYKFHFKDAKKMKEKENANELLYMFYEDNMTQDEYNNMFKVSIEHNKGFAKNMNSMEIAGFKKILEEEDFRLDEITYDDDMDEIIKTHRADLEEFVSSQYSKLRGKKNYDKAAQNFIKGLPLEYSVRSISDMMRMLPHVDEKSFFVYKEKIKFIKASDEEFKNQLDTIKWPIHVDFLFEKLTQLYGFKTSIVADVLSNNVLTKGSHKFLERICEFKYLCQLTDHKKKFFNSNKKRLPGYTSLSRPKYKDDDGDDLFEDKFTSSQSKFQISNLNSQYREFHQKKKSGYKESFETSFKLANNIKNHLKKEESKIIYSEPASDKDKYKSAEMININRIQWPEVMNAQRKSGQTKLNTTFKKERVQHPQMNHVISELIKATHTSTPNPQQAQRPSQGPMVGPSGQSGPPIQQGMSGHPSSGYSQQQMGQYQGGQRPQGMPYGPSGQPGQPGQPGPSRMVQEGRQPHQGTLPSMQHQGSSGHPNHPQYRPQQGHHPSGGGGIHEEAGTPSHSYNPQSQQHPHGQGQPMHPQGHRPHPQGQGGHMGGGGGGGSGMHPSMRPQQIGQPYPGGQGGGHPQGHSQMHGHGQGSNHGPSPGYQGNPQQRMMGNPQQAMSRGGHSDLHPSNYGNQVPSMHMQGGGQMSQQQQQQRQQANYHQYQMKGINDMNGMNMRQQGTPNSGTPMMKKNSK